MSTTKPYVVPPPGVPAPPVYTPQELEQIAARKKLQAKKQQRKDAARRRWALLNRFVDEGMASLERSDVAVWIVLFRHAGADGVTSVSKSRLASVTGQDPKTVTVALRRLAGAGWISRLRRGGPTDGCAVYRVQKPHSGGEI